jgi:Xaa-Pro aminopeptidase
MAFTSEPGIYLVDRFGVRIEDVLAVREGEDGPDVLSGRRAGGPWDP